MKPIIQLEGFFVKQNLKEKLIGFFLFFALILLSWNVFHSWQLLSEREKMIKQAEAQLRQLEEQNSTLKRNLAQTQTTEFIERELRNRLNLGKEGEIMVILPSITEVFEPTPTPVASGSNLEKWIRLFL